MRIPRLSPRDRRAAAVGAAIVGASLAWSLGAAPYLAALADARDGLAAERGLLERERALLAAAAAYPALFDSGAARLMEVVPRLVGGADDGARAAALAGYLRGVARAAPVHLARLEPVAAAEAGAAVRALPVTVSGEGDLEGLLTFLHLLETGPKLVQVSGLRMEAAAPRVGAAYASAAAFAQYPGSEAPETIRFRFTATAFSLAAPEEGS